MNTKFVKTLAVVIATVVVFVSNPTSTLANGGGVDTKKSTLTEEQVSVKYQGTSETSIRFKVEFENPTSEKFNLIIKNDNGDVIFNQQFSEAHFSKSVLFQNTDTEFRPTFIIRSANGEIVRTFEVSKTLTENTVVTRL